MKKRLNRLVSKSIHEKAQKNPSPSFDLEINISTFRQIIADSNDVGFRRFMVAQTVPAALFYIKGLTKVETIEREVLTPLLRCPKETLERTPSSEWVNLLSQDVVTVTELSVHETYEQAIPSLLTGHSLIMLEGVDKLITLSTKKIEHRSIEEPESEVTIRGPRDGFIESLETNIALLRTRIINPDLTVQVGNIGQHLKNRYAIVYIKGLCKSELVDEVCYRIACINEDVQETGAVEQLLQDEPMTIFPQLSHTERPDKAVSEMLKGKVVILLNGSPFALMAPVKLSELLNSPEDDYQNWVFSSLIRLLRYLALFISILLPSIYIALTSFHPGLIPTQLALSIAAAREGVPFPAFLEAIFMEIAIELLREAGVRLPRLIGSTVGIVGGLIIGEAAVRAGIVSPIMVIVVALTAIASFVLPAYSVSITFRILRFLMMFAAASLGLYGIILVYIAINIHLVGLRSFGEYYMTPFAPLKLKSWFEVIVRAPFTSLKPQGGQKNEQKMP
ncbi:spore germination protein [Halalkalibacterium halodurans]|uniref:spore germination protein n=1 Tax=Halalkalibacterium halodurans TaxID=86665 RepID=UPI002E200150|nr:spore germination protein [Halalkalibacterium halodurans]MED4085939.1 spore germination protein [Halalkalibacterium halodurans]MED4104033.1 spore germination protein [Halalkalibacterium halodurans]MED4109816.1 spore germination protein [Halalkalibacterium halodurans]MED4149418.1 spore germination protein [Halalkalibacterium halodurans]